MMTEDVVERYRFTCVRCAHDWLGDYQVRHATDIEGETYSFYSLGGFPCEAPGAADILCPSCHCGPVHVVLVGRTLTTARTGPRPARS